MSRTGASQNKRDDAATPGIGAISVIFVRTFAGRRAIPVWIAFAAICFAALLAFDRGATEETTAPPQTSSGITSEARESQEETLDMANHLAKASWNLLSSMGWGERVGDGLGIWVSIGEQKLRVIRGSAIVAETRCSTAAKGPGSRADSFQTPLGWHSVAEKFGDDAPWGQVFRDKHATKEIWKRGEPVKEDLVLTRMLTLRGEEPGRNKGGDVDSFDRNIYIHGTNDEEKIGTPASHGCVRLTNDDVIALHKMIPLNTPMLITEE
jgi:hypothetical protein